MAYAIGVDFGTLSGRALLLDLDSGQEVAAVEVPYPHGVLDERLPAGGDNLPPDWALQDPDDYLYVLEKAVPELLRRSRVTADQIVGIGVDATSCTVLPVLEDGTPLCRLPEFRQRPHAWPKLWKHHAAQPWATRLTEVAAETGESFLSRYGGRISSEWYYPKLLEIFHDDPETYRTMRWFVEATDWIVWQLTGQLMRNSCTAGYKALWDPQNGIPSLAYFTRVHPNFTHPGEKLGHTFYPVGTPAGTLSPAMARRLGLPTTVTVAVGNVDAHVSMVGAGVTDPGPLVMVIGTSICNLMISSQDIRVPGITGVIPDGILPGYYGYESGQAAVGDMYAWFVQQAVPPSYFEQAAEAGLNIYAYLERLAEPLRPGETGLIALDWWNGNRSILGDADLSGLLVGQTLATKPEHIYRALLESTAFGTRRTIDNFVEHGVPVTEIVAVGGISHKSPLLMQIYADVTGLPVKVLDSSEIPARGSAVFAAVAAAGGDAALVARLGRQLAPPVRHIYRPRVGRHEAYNLLYRHYKTLYEFFGQTRQDIMHDLKAWRNWEQPAHEEA